MSVGESIYRIALDEVGIKEIVGAFAHPRILEYHSAVSLRATSDETPWCAAFVNWCLKQGGIRGTDSAMAKSFLHWGSPIGLDEADLGDIVVFSGSNPWSGHVAFFSSRAEGGKVSVLGGNQSNSVCLSPYPTHKIISIRRHKP